MVIEFVETGFENAFNFFKTAKGGHGDVSYLQLHQDLAEVLVTGHPSWKIPQTEETEAQSWGCKNQTRLSD